MNSLSVRSKKKKDSAEKKKGMCKRPAWEKRKIGRGDITDQEICLPSLEKKKGERKSSREGGPRNYNPLRKW